MAIKYFWLYDKALIAKLMATLVQQNEEEVNSENKHQRFGRST